MIGQRIRRLTRRDDGTTLIELLVAMFLVSILGIAVVMSVSAFSRNSLKQTTRTRATEQAQVTIDRASRLLRTATAVDGTTITATAANEVTFYANLADPKGPQLVDLKVVPHGTLGWLQESVTRADAVSQTQGKSYTYTGTATTRYDGRDIDTSAGNLFTYYQLASGGGLTAMTPPLSSAQLGNLAAIGITLHNREPGVSATVNDTTLVYLRNVEYSPNS